MSTRRLSPSDRAFLRNVAQAVVANPFSEERSRLDLTIAGLPPGTPAGEALRGVLTRVRAWLARQDEGGPAAVTDYTDEDDGLVEQAVLFDCFHRHMAAMDAHIRQQVENARAPCRVGFAAEALADLGRRGISGEEAARYFAMFFQLRRAFYFIERALVGRSAAMTQLRRSLWNSVFTCDLGLYARKLWQRMEDFSTLLLGETGTGKGAAATAIGRSGFIPYDPAGQRFATSFMDSFLAINLSQFPESLIESELFGHRKGAFTGAVEAHEGVFARCSSHGAIFLDEIGDVSIPVQIKLLQVLQSRTFAPVGSHETRRFEGRVIAASNRPIAELRRARLFRDDFYYRLCSDTIAVPPLRQRLSECPAELDDLLGVIVARLLGAPDAALATAARAAIDRDLGPAYPWPGNVRELEQCVRRVLLTGACGGASPPAADLQERLVEGVRAGSYPAQALLADYCRLLYARLGTYEETARRTGLDRRTVRKYVGVDSPARPRL